MGDWWLSSQASIGDCDSTPHARFSGAQVAPNCNLCRNSDAVSSTFTSVVCLFPSVPFLSSSLFCQPPCCDYPRPSNIQDASRSPRKCARYNSYIGMRKRYRAAVKIQSQHRGNVGRAAARARKHAFVSRIQRMYRAFASRRALSEWKQSIVWSFRRQGMVFETVS